MVMIFNKIFGPGLLVLALTAGVGIANAQTIAQPAPACLSLNYGLSIGATDASTGGLVTALQNFLASQGYFNAAYLGTGRFGPITYAAVVRFQAAQGISAIGIVGPLTRAAIARVGCGVNPNPPPTNNPISLYSLSPGVAVVGNTVSITGFGFTSSNTVLMDGSVAAQGVPITSSIAIACTTNPTCHGGINQTIQFAVPSYLSPNCPPGSMCPMYVRQLTPGQYAITVQNTNGTSNALTLTITSGGSTGQPLSINGLDAPSTLALGAQGTWTVHVLAGSGTGNLHYSVVWGDENMYGSSIMAPQTTSTQTSATFTHAYQYAGTYTPVFTVTDDIGHGVSASNTITITPLY